MKSYEGILDRVSFPDHLSAAVVEPTPDPRIHGYAVQAELGRAVGFLDVAWLALTGELPTTRDSDALSRALTWLAPVHVGDGPTHAAVLAKVAGSPEESVPAIAAVALGQHVARELADLAEFFAWLPVRSAPVPAGVREPAATPAQREVWRRLCADMSTWFGAEHAFDSEVPLQRVPTAYALLHLLGVRDLPRLLALASVARLPVILAEAACTGSGSVMRYPTKTPRYLYVEEA
jgi:hypothetical protein